MKVLMVGVDKSTKGGMWTVVQNYFDNPEFISENGISYIPTSITGCSVFKRLLFSFKSILRVKREIKTNNYDILHAHVSERFSLIRKGILLRFAKKHHLKTILHMHGAEFQDLYEKMSPRKKKKIKRIVDTADRVIILGEYWVDFVSSLVSDPKKIKVVYNAVSVPSSNLYNKDGNVLLFLGAVVKRKGIDVLLDALSQFPNSFKNSFKVLIYGPNPSKDIENKIKEHGLFNFVDYKGWLSLEEKPKVFEKTILNILPSFNEGLPMTILETMSYGIPNISTRIAAIPEAINKDNGVLLEPGDIDGLRNAIIDLATNADKRFSMSSECYSICQSKFSISVHLKSIATIYSNLLK